MRGACGLILIALGLGACASAPEHPPEIGYLAPSGVPPTARSALVQQQPSLVLGNLVDRLQQASFHVAHLDEQARVVVVEYTGDPEPYVDCGWIIAYQTGALQRIPAATATAAFDRTIDQNPVELNRGLRLDGRMVVSFEPEGRDTVVRTDTTYVLTKTVEAAGRGGDSRGRIRETISFKNGASGTFNKGTRCQPNGRLERVVLDSLPSTSVVRPRERAPVMTSEAQAEPLGPGAVEEPRDVLPAPPVTDSAPAVAPPPRSAPPAPAMVAEPEVVAAPRAPSEPPEVVEAKIAAVVDTLTCAAVAAEVGSDGVRLTGYVGTAQDLERLRRSADEIAGPGAVKTDLEVHPWPFCELLAVIAAYRDVDPAPDLGLALITSDRNTRLSAGDALTLDIFLPPDARYLYLGYVQNDGRVGYITTMPVREWAEGTGAIRFETGFEISAPFGREMIVAVTSRRPLFDAPRPAYEPADAYIAALRQRLAALRASDPDAPPAASSLVITTRASPAS